MPHTYAKQELEEWYKKLPETAEQDFLIFQNQKVLALNQDLLTRRVVESNHTPKRSSQSINLEPQPCGHTLPPSPQIYFISIHNEKQSQENLRIAFENPLSVVSQIDTRHHYSRPCYCVKAPFVDNF